MRFSVRCCFSALQSSLSAAGCSVVDGGPSPASYSLLTPQIQQVNLFLYVHYVTIITDDREEGDRDGVSGVRMLDVLDDAENRGGRGAREKPRGYAGGAELEKRSDIIFRF